MLRKRSMMITVSTLLIAAACGGVESGPKNVHKTSYGSVVATTMRADNGDIASTLRATSGALLATLTLKASNSTGVIEVLGREGQAYVPAAMMGDGSLAGYNDAVHQLWRWSQADKATSKYANYCMQYCVQECGWWNIFVFICSYDCNNKCTAMQN